jgi:hypothetical protein
MTDCIEENVWEKTEGDARLVLVTKYAKDVISLALSDTCLLIDAVALVSKNGIGVDAASPDAAVEL